MSFNFHIYLWDQPIDTVLPWYAGQQRGVCMNEKTGALAKNWHVGMFEHPPGTSVPAYGDLPSVCSAGPLSPPYWDTRLIQVTGAENLTVLEAGFDLTDIGGGDQISGLMGAQFFSFRYAEQDDKPFLVSFSVTRDHEMVRGVTAHGSESTASLSAWKFHEKGTPQPWEVVSRYEAKKKSPRLTHDHLLEYMSKVGFDYQNYRYRRFERVVDFGPTGQAQEIVGYDEQARMVNEAFDARFEAFMNEFE